jgi:uncharacterized protein YciI
MPTPYHTCFLPTSVPAPPFASQDKAYVVFSEAGAAERFVENDPYVKNGIVTAYTIREWSVVEGL